MLGFPYIFRGALDCGATEINEPMKLAAVRAIAALAKEPVPSVVNAARPHGACCRYCPLQTLPAYGLTSVLPQKCGAVTQEMVMSMAPNPIVFALANPDPEIAYDVAVASRSGPQPERRW